MRSIEKHTFLSHTSAIMMAKLKSNLRGGKKRVLIKPPAGTGRKNQLLRKLFPEKEKKATICLWQSAGDPISDSL